MTEACSASRVECFREIWHGNAFGRLHPPKVLLQLKSRLNFICSPHWNPLRFCLARGGFQQPSTSLERESERLSGEVLA